MTLFRLKQEPTHLAFARELTDWYQLIGKHNARCVNELLLFQASLSEWDRYLREPDALKAIMLNGNTSEAKVKLALSLSPSAPRLLLDAFEIPSLEEVNEDFKQVTQQELLYHLLRKADSESGQRVAYLCARILYERMHIELWEECDKAMVIARKCIIHPEDRDAYEQLRPQRRVASNIWHKLLDRGHREETFVEWGLCMTAIQEHSKIHQQKPLSQRGFNIADVQTRFGGLRFCENINGYPHHFYLYLFPWLMGIYDPLDYEQSED